MKWTVQQYFNSGIFHFIGPASRMGAANYDVSITASVPPPPTYFYTDFAQYSSTNPPASADWEKFYSQGANDGFLKASVPVSGTGNVMKAVISTTDQYAIFAWTSVGSNHDYEMLAKIFYHDGDDLYGNGIGCRMNKTSAVDDTLGISMHIDHVQDMEVWVATSGFVYNQIIGPIAKYTPAEGDPVWMRLRVEGSTVHAKHWISSLNVEPSAWDASSPVTYNNHASGFAGIWNRAGSGAHIYRYDRLAIATSAGVANFETYVSTVLRDNPVIYYQLNEQSSVTVVDSIGTASSLYDGAYSSANDINNGDPIIYETVSARSAKFDGDGNYIYAASVPVLGKTWTLEAWVICDASSPGCGIINPEYNDSLGPIPFMLGLNNNGAGSTTELQMGHFWNPSWYVVAEASAFPLNSVQHVVGAKDDGAMRLYRNGAQVAVLSTTVSCSHDSSATLRVARRYSNSGVHPYFDGNVQHVAIYSSALSEERIRTHYYIGKDLLDSLPGYVAPPPTFDGYTDFSEYPLSSTLHDWTQLDFLTGDSSAFVSTHASAVGGQVGQFKMNGSGDWGMYSWNKAGVGADWEVLCKFFYQTGDDIFGNCIGSRLLVAGDQLYGITANIDNADDFELWAHASGVSDQLAGPIANFTLADGDPVFIRLRAFASVIQAKHWTSTLTAEPSAWDVSAEVSSNYYTGADGGAGFVFRAGGAGVTYTADQFAVDSEGGTATFRTYASTVIRDGAIHYWPLNEAASTIAITDVITASSTFDASATSSTITGGTPLIYDSASTRSAHFRGQAFADHIIAASAPNVGSHDFTFELWVECSASCPGTGIITTLYDGEQIPYMIGLGGNETTTSRLSFGHYTGTWYQAQEASAVPLGQTFHVAGRKTATGLHLYRDGVRTADLSSTVSAIHDPDARIMFGRRHDGSGSHDYFNGRVQHVAIYASALSSAKIATHYALGKDLFDTPHDYS